MKNKKDINILRKITDYVEDFFLKILKSIGLKKFVSWYQKHQEVMRYLIFGFICLI